MPSNTTSMLNIIKYYKFWFMVSAVLLIAGIVALVLFGLNLGIDFKGGTLTQVQFAENVPALNEIQAVLDQSNISNSHIQPTGERSVIIRTGPLENDRHQAMLGALSDKFGSVSEEQYTSIGPIIGKELKSGAIVQLILVSLGIILYIAYAFRKVTKPVSSWRFGVAAIIALLHDLLIVIGFFAILGRFKGVEIDSLFVTALLTVLGFSVHDTIVVFDRIRETLKKYPYKPFGAIVDYAVSSTLARSINTSSTLIFVLIAMSLFGGATVFYFVLSLLIFFTFGTYSSIFIASPVLYLWQKR